MILVHNVAKMPSVITVNVLVLQNIQKAILTHIKDVNLNV